MTELIQNFSVPTGNDVAVSLKVSPALNLDTLEGSTIYWRVYRQALGIRITDDSPSALIEKSTRAGSIVLPSPPAMQCTIMIQRADTLGLLRNYIHRTTLIDVAGHESTLNSGIMTVTD